MTHEVSSASTKKMKIPDACIDPESTARLARLAAEVAFVPTVIPTRGRSKAVLGGSPEYEEAPRDPPCEN
jgi:hypothetical protein